MKIFGLKCVLIEFAIPNLSLIYFVYQTSLKLTFKTGFLTTKLNSQRLLCSQKTGIKLYH